VNRALPLRDYSDRGALRAGNPEVEGLCLALSDWSAELRMLQQTNKSRRGGTPAASSSSVDVAQPLIE
jgi:hypothetical protein